MNENDLPITFLSAEEVRFQTCGPVQGKQDVEIDTMLYGNSDTI